MKRYIYIIAFVLFSIMGHSQIWLEGFALYSSPMQDGASSSTRDIRIDDNIYTLQNKCLFRTFAESSFGGGIHFRYVKNQLIVGMQIEYVEYQPATPLLRMTMFRLGPTVEYFFLPKGKIHPYVGGEVGIQQPKVFYNGEIINRGQLSATYIGVGARGGVAYDLSQKFAVRLGLKYVYLRDLPYLDVSLGIAYNFGDF